MISLCVPIMNRLHDLRQTLPLIIQTAKASRPAEIVILDYNSTDGLREFVRTKYGIKYFRYEGHEHFRMAHARNLAAKCCTGEYIVEVCADAVLHVAYVGVLRMLIADGCVWMRPRHFKGIVCVQRAEFMAAGGYDERFVLYGGEDKELEARLKRRGSKFGLVPDGLVGVIRTSDKDKLANYGSSLTKREMMQEGARIRKENAKAKLLVANEGREWGMWR